MRGSDRIRRWAATPSGRALQRLESRVAPHVPRSVREVWRGLLGRPPLPTSRVPPPLAVLQPALPESAEDDARIAEILALRGGPDVVCLPIIDWHFRHQRPQQLALEMVKAGRRVFWIEPESLKHPRDRVGEGPLEVDEPVRGLYRVSLDCVRELDHFRSAMDAVDVLAAAGTLARLRDEYGIVSAITLAQLPFWTLLALHLRVSFGWRLVYDCMDDHAGFDSNDAAMLASEDELIRASDLTVVTSRRLRERVADHARVVVDVPNACAYEHFAPARDASAESAGEARRPTIGYFGAISAWFDFDLLRHAVRAHPEWDFVLIGSTWGAPDHADLLGAPNVRFLGELPYDELPRYLARFDVATIPFRLTPLILATSPVKFYEYLAAGKPVVASRLPELEPNPDLALLADDPESFTGALERALREDSPERAQARQEFAATHTWSRRCADLLRAADATFPLVSIAIVTWNNLALTRACIESLLHEKSWPSVEIVIADNASSDGTVQELEELARRHAFVHIVLNRENRGFAAANNQAIEMARGAYVVLLNNDTVVAPGWLPRLVRVLDEDPRIGLVGPISNAVWNEALEFLLPPDLEPFPEFAERWARAHLRELYPIRMLAMFCVAGRAETFRSVGPLDERFGIGMFEDDDYAYRVRLAGLRLVCAEEVYIRHFGQASFELRGDRQRLHDENRRKFEAKWNVAWQPYSGDRRVTRRWKREIDVLVQRLAGGAPPVVVLAGDAPVGDRAPVMALAAELARRGHATLVHREPGDGHAVGVVRPAERLVLAMVPIEAFEDVAGAIVAPLPGRAFGAAWLYDARAVVRLAEGWERDVALAVDAILAQLAAS
jgi:GT2 family glycosyltransferase/glycosyltransferase involved in cell wall biosynthesis